MTDAWKEVMAQNIGEIAETIVQKMG